MNTKYGRIPLYLILWSLWCIK